MSRPPLLQVPEERSGRGTEPKKEVTMVSSRGRLRKVKRLNSDEEGEDGLLRLGEGSDVERDEGSMAERASAMDSEAEV